MSKEKGFHEEIYNNNQVKVVGQLENEFEFMYGTQFVDYYRTRVVCSRPRGKQDMIPIVVSEVLIGSDRLNESLKGKWVEVTGNFRSRNYVGKDKKNHLDLFLFVTDIMIYDNQYEVYGKEHINHVFFRGRVCKPPLVRETPTGKRLAEMILAVHRSNEKVDYIPCIAWEKYSWIAEGLKVGSQIEALGRIQSRVYFKKLPNFPGGGEYRTAYEVSLGNFNEVISVR